jgi:hypothetical protein
MQNASHAAEKVARYYALQQQKKEIESEMESKRCFKAVLTAIKLAS